MAKTFSDAPHYAGQISSEYLLGIQIGNTPSADGGLEQMMYVKASELRAFMREGMASVYNYRGEYSSLPTDLAVGDTFYAASSFSEGGNTYLAGHLYAYNGTSWDDITNILTQYAQQAEVDSINERLTEAEEKIDALSGFIFKGDATRATLPTASASNQGWVYYLTDESIYVASDGTQWVTVMNYVVQTITEGDTTHAPSSDAVYKALAQRDAKDADLQSQIVNTNAELDNVEALIGGDAQVENTDPTEGESLFAQSRMIHHANLLPNGSFGRLGARSVAWNQLVQNGNFDSTDNWTVSASGITFSVSNNVATISYTEAYRGISQQISFLKGHKYLVRVDLKKVDADANVQAVISDNLYFTLTISTDNVGTSWTSCEAIVSTDTEVGSYTALFIRNGSSGYASAKSVQARNVMVFDLTATNMASLTADQFRYLFPAFYYPNDTGHIYDLNPSGFLVRGVNLWDEKWERGSYNLSTGEKTDYVNNFRNKTVISVNPSKTYYFMTPYNSYALCYDASGSYLGYIAIVAPYTVFSPLSGTETINITVGASGADYGNNIQICDNSLPISIKATYHPYEGQTVDTPQIADGHYINENCYDYVENVVENGVIKGKNHKKVRVVDLGTLNWEYITSFTNPAFRCMQPNFPDDAKAGFMKLLCARYKDVGAYQSWSNIADQGNMVIGVVQGAYRGVVIRDDSYTSASAFKTAMSGIMLYYELAEEEITDCEPLRSFGISDYSTVEPITPQDELVNRIDVPFSVKSVSANTLIEQINQNTADIAEEKAIRSAQVSALDKRVTNLELKTGDQFDVDYPSDTYGMDGVPSNVEPYAEVSVLKGVGRGANQLVDTTKLASYNATQNVSGTAFDITTIVSAGYGGFRGIDLVTGHVYLFAVVCKTKASSSIRVGWFNSQGQGVVPSFTYLSQGFNAQLFTPSVSGTDNQFLFYGEVGKTDYYDNFIICDLNVYFNTSDLSFLGSTDSAKLATIQQKYPEILELSDNGTEAVFPTYEAVKSVGRNLAKTNPERLETLVNIPTFDADKCIKVTAGIQYYWEIFEKNFTSYRMALFFYDTQGNPLETPSTSWVTEYNSQGFYVNGKGLLWGANVSGSWNNKWTFSQNFYIRILFGLGDTTSSSVISKFCFNVSDADDGTFTEYFEDTLTLPTPMPLKGARSVAEEYYPETGRVTHPIKFGDITTIGTWGYTTNSSGIPFFYVLLPDYAGSANLLLAGFTGGLTSRNQITKDKELSSWNAAGNPNIAFTNLAYTDIDSCKSAMSGLILYYESATPDPDTYVDPLPDNYIKVEPNGTVKAIQSQSPEVDSAMTVEYMAS